ncbi:MAG: gluconeogenesis factor YvcK family protein [bacterium]
MKKLKHVVCLGGGHGMPKAVLTGLKKYPIKISAICAMLDSGGSAGRLRKHYKIVSSGDIRRALLALADTSPIIENLFNYRFQVGELKDHNFANLFITALELVTNDYEKTIKEIRRILKVKHEVLPSTLDVANLYAVLENGKTISGEANIDRPKHDGNLKIKKVYLKPTARAFPRALEVIKKADMIVIGPGDLYSSLAQIILVEGMKEAITKSKAKKVFLCNLMTKYGETNNFSVLEFANEMEKYLEASLTYVIYNTRIPTGEQLAELRKDHPELMIPVSAGRKLPKDKFVGRDLMGKSGPIEHDPEKVTRILISLLEK